MAEHLMGANSRSALITGGSGFVGRNLVRRLVREGWRVHVLLRRESCLPDTPEFSAVKRHDYDGQTVSVVNSMQDAKPDVVFHLASLFLAQHASDDIESLVAANVLLGSQLLQGMSEAAASCLINTGTSWQHYENEAYRPVNLYAATKQAFEAILSYYTQACAIRAINLQLFDTYGPDDTRPKLFSLLQRAAASGELLDMSPGEQLIDLVHIDDVVEAYWIAAQRLFGDPRIQCDTYVVSSGNPLALRALVERYARVTDQVLRVQWGKRAYRNREVMVPWSKGKLLPGWKPQISLDAGLATLADRDSEN